MERTRVPSMPYNDPSTSTNLASSPFPFSSFLTDSLFSLDPTVSGPPPPAPPPPVQHQAGLFVHSKEINPFERSFAVVDSTSIPEPKTFAHGGNRHANTIGMSDLYLPTPKGRRKRALSSPALFTPGGTGEDIDDGTAQAFRQAKRPSLRLAPDEKVLPPIPGLARGFVDSSSSFALSDSTGSSRSNTSVSFDDDPNFRPKIQHGQSSIESPDSSISLSPETSKPPIQLRASSIDPYTSSLNVASGPPNFAHYQPQPIPFTINSIAPNTLPYSSAARPFSSTNFATTTLAPASVPLAPASVPPPVSVPLANSLSLAAFNPSLSYTSTEDASFPFSDPFALVPQHAQPAAVYPAPPPPVPHSLTHHPIIPAHDASALNGSSLLAQAPPPAPPPPPHHFTPVAPPQPSTSAPLAFAPQPLPRSHSQPELVESPATTQPLPPPRPTGKKRGRKPKNWDPSLEVEVILEPEEAERQRKLALERNRIAASKSRRRKKEKVQALEGAARGFCEGNQLLQNQCQALLAEVHQLRAYLIQSHPKPNCKCQHVHGYFNREREGGGLNAIMFESQGTLERDFSKPPRWGSEEDLYVGIEIGRPGQSSRGGGGGGKSAAGKAKQKALAKKGGKKSAEAESADEDDDDEDDDDDEGMSEEESEEEKVALKSRRARAIPLRKA